MIQELNGRCDFAENGMQAVKFVKDSLENYDEDNSLACLYNLILLDYSMPLLDGPNTAKAIYRLYKSDKWVHLKPPYIVCLTAFTEKVFQDKAIKSGM